MSKRMTDAEVADLIIPLVGRHGYADALSRKCHAEITTLRAEVERLKASRDSVLEEAAQAIEAMYGRGMTLEHAAAIRALKSKP